MHAAVVKPFVRVDVPLVAQLCHSVHWRRRLSPNAASFCVTRSKLGETVNLKLNTPASELDKLRVEIGMETDVTKDAVSMTYEVIDYTEGVCSHDVLT